MRRATINQKGFAYLDLVDVADGVVELHGTALLQTSLLGVAAVCAGRAGCGCGGVCISRTGSVAHGRTVLRSWHSSLLDRTRTVKRSSLARPGETRLTVLRRRTERGFRAFRTMRQRRLPAGSCAQESLCSPPGCGLVLGRPSSADRVDRGARGRRDANAVGVVFETAFDSIPGRQEGIETLD